ncbi:hypothetical protein L3Y34_013944 [Caenorhabditis briggsae]|uniref:Kinesin-like protein n=2 Tax=Caenorhabditis briggsae TaxID=6238 RepID=A0AAE9DQR7_CAEBR|nr:hypothetical protein L3Y34_013944 [Caenorhabditis briggsae]
MDTTSNLTMTTRKKVSEATSHIRVAVRIRPLNGAERSDKCTSIARSDKIKNTVELKAKPFGPFSRVFDTDTTQAEIYADLVSPQIKKVIAGFNCTVFAYGQTGTGKTFTMEGGRTDAKSSQDDPTTGIIPRAVEDIFEKLESSKCEEYSLRVSYVELYNEELLDLLASSDDEDRERLRIFDDPHKKGVIVSGVEEVPVRSRSDVFKLLKTGAEKRKTAATLMNMNSSRSHSLFMVNVVVRENTNTGEELVKQGKLNLVDLAGSENIGRSGAQGNRAKEAGSINQSLLTLGRVIRSLTTNAQHVPYRESKLTRLLQDSLGGSTITSLIATLSPSSSNFEESQSTLEYAMRAANIKNKPVCNTKVSKKTILKEYSDEIEKLRRDLRAAREKNGVIISEESHEEFQRNTEKVNELEQKLDSAVDRLRRYTEDLLYMDDQYKQLYERKGELESRLRESHREYAEKVVELAETNDVLNKNIEAIGVMHTNALKSFDQLLQSREAADELTTDIAAFWRKVDDMGAADDRNKDIFEAFRRKMTSFIEKTSLQAEAFANDGRLASEEFVHEVTPHVKTFGSVADSIDQSSKEIQTSLMNVFQQTTEIEENAANTINSLSNDNREQWDAVLKTCVEYYKAHATRSEELSKQLTEKLAEIKRQVAAFANDVRPLLTEIRNTTSDSFEKRVQQSDENVAEVKKTCSGMAETLKMLMQQVEQLSVKAEENHERQLIGDQNTQESILSTINAAENVIQSVEDVIEECCDVKEVEDSARGDLDDIDMDMENAVKEARERAVEKDREVKKVTSTLLEKANAIREETTAQVEAALGRYSTTSETCRTTGESLQTKVQESLERTMSLFTMFAEATHIVTEEATGAINAVKMTFVDPSNNVPPRIIPEYPASEKLVKPVEPETLLGMEEDAEDGSDGELAKKKRRVTAFVRRDSLLDSTNFFPSPNAIQKRREAPIDEEEDTEN